MLKVAVSALDSNVHSMVPDLFIDTSHLLIIDADRNRLLQVVDSGDPDPFRRSMLFAQKVVELDCEALLCGGLDAEPFAVLAEENCVTRYNASGLSALNGVKWMNDNMLELITDFIGGTGCPEPDPANCALDDAEEED